LVEFEGINTTTDNFGLDKTYSIIVRFHERRLFEDQNLYVREGDYIQYGSSFFEIVSLLEDRQLFGQVNHLFQIEAKCIRTRRGLINLSVLPEDVQASLVATTSDTTTTSSPTSPSSPSSPISGNVVRVVYTTPETYATIPAGSSVKSLLGVTETIILEKTAIYDDGLRQLLTDSSLTGEFYIHCGDIFTNFEIPADTRLILEILTLV